MVGCGRVLSVICWKVDLLVSPGPRMNCYFKDYFPGNRMLLYDVDWLRKRRVKVVHAALMLRKRELGINRPGNEPFIALFLCIFFCITVAVPVGLSLPAHSSLSVCDVLFDRFYESCAWNFYRLKAKGTSFTLIRPCQPINR